MAPPGTLTASGTRSPPRARRTELADGDAGLLLGLVGGRAEVRGDDDRLVVEQRALGRRLRGEHVDAGAGDAALGERVGERLLVDRCHRGRR